MLDITSSLSHVFDLRNLNIGILVGILAAVAMLRLQIHRSAPALAVTTIALMLGFSQWLAPAVMAIAIIWGCGHLQNKKYSGLLTSTALASALLGRLLSRSRDSRWGGQGLGALVVLLAVALHDIARIPVPMLFLLAVETFAVWLASTHLEDECFYTDADGNAPRDPLAKTVRAARALESFLVDGWRENRRLALIGSVVVVLVIQRDAGVPLSGVVAWIEVLSVTWTTGRYHA